MASSDRESGPGVRGSRLRQELHIAWPIQYIVVLTHQLIDFLSLFFFFLLQSWAKIVPDRDEAKQRTTALRTMGGASLREPKFTADVQCQRLYLVGRACMSYQEPCRHT
jgi:hypothetical protein